jgi:lipoate-protein ligase A
MADDQDDKNSVNMGAHGRLRDDRAHGPEDADPEDLDARFVREGATRRGSYKMPGGKLANATVVIGPPPDYRLTSVRFDGDYSVDAVHADGLMSALSDSGRQSSDSGKDTDDPDKSADLSLGFLGRALEGISVRGQSHRLHLHVVAELEERLATALADHPSVTVSGMDARGFAIAVFHALSGQSVEEGTSTVAGPGHSTSPSESSTQTGSMQADTASTTAGGQTPSTAMNDTASDCASGQADRASGQADRASDQSASAHTSHHLPSGPWIAGRWADAQIGLVDPQETLDHSYSPSMQMALDEVISRRTAAGKLPPLLRFWQWAGPAVIIGRFQSLSHEVDLGQARLAHVDVVRRETGGGAMFVEPGNTITYSLTVPLSFARGLDAEGTYVLCESWAIDALRSLRIDARHAPLNDISSPAGKIGGAAERRYPALHAGEPGALLHHTTMAYDIDAAKMNRILTPNRTKLAAHAVSSAAKRVDPLKSQTGLSREEIIRQMAVWLVDSVPGIMSGTIPDDVIEEARALAASKYENPEWTGIIE